jgi:hypothetical protein
MELKKFVKEVLIEITEAVEEAKSEAKLSIAPFRLIDKSDIIKVVKEPQFIEFDIGLNVKNSNSKKSKTGLGMSISVVKADANGLKESNEEKNYDHRIKFSVPVYFQASSTKRTD